MERITMDEYLEEKAKCKAKYGRWYYDRRKY
jgi:hypothetical protein